MPGITPPLFKAEIDLGLRFRHREGKGNWAERGLCGRSPAAVSAHHLAKGPEATMPRALPRPHRSASHQLQQPIDDRWRWAPAHRLDGNEHCPTPANHEHVPSVVLRFAHVDRAQIANIAMAPPRGHQPAWIPVRGNQEALGSRRCNKATPDESGTPRSSGRSTAHILPPVQRPSTRT